MNNLLKNDLVLVVFGGLLGLGLHQLLAGGHYTALNPVQPLYVYYAYLGAMAALFVFLMRQIDKLNSNYVGLGFLAFLMLQLVFVYLLGRDIFEQKHEGINPLSLHFLSIFFIYLLIQLALTVRILNKKQ